MTQPTYGKSVTMAEVNKWYKKEETLRKGTAIISVEPLFGKTPVDLLRDPSIRAVLKGLYSLLHSFCCNEKQLHLTPLTFVSQKLLAEKCLGVSQQTVSRWMMELENLGWITIIRLGQGRSSIKILHDRKGKEFTKDQRKQFVREVRVQQAKYPQVSN